MGKAVHNDVLDAALAEVATANIMTLCSQEPTTRTEAVTTYALADVAMTPGDGNDYTIADGDTNGRKVTVSEEQRHGGHDRHRDARRPLRRLDVALRHHLHLEGRHRFGRGQLPGLGHRNRRSDLTGGARAYSLGCLSDR